MDCAPAMFTFGERSELVLRCIQVIHRGIALLVFPGAGRDLFAP
jgi:hypothetical protein